jgi:23S rRNA G2445 N2-methylase RlmL
VELKEPQLNVYVDIYDDTATIGIGLLPEASFLARRRVETEAGVHEGGSCATPMRRSTCYAMLRLLDLQPGQVVLDCMCGSGSLTIEGSINFDQAVHLGGDISATDIAKARANAVLQRRTKVDVAVLDACRLPIRAGAVDAVVVDLPFGGRLLHLHTAAVLTDILS